MKRQYSGIKREIMDLFGVISIEEIVRNRPVVNLMEEISDSLSGISLIKAE